MGKKLMLNNLPVCSGCIKICSRTFFFLHVCKLFEKNSECECDLQIKIQVQKFFRSKAFASYQLFFILCTLILILISDIIS